MNLNSLHKSISEKSKDEVLILIRYLRDLRRQQIDVPQKSVLRKSKKSKKQMLTKNTIDRSITKMNPEEKAKLLKKLLKIKERKHGRKS